MRPTIVTACAAALFCGSAARGQVTSAFTYQGELQAAGEPAEGSFDLRFGLYDESGTPVGAALCFDNVSVLRGRFSVLLDFGNQFSGLEKRYLEVSVRPDAGADCSDPTGFDTLAPRQELTAAPYASSSLSAANALRLGDEPAAAYRDASNLSAGTLPLGRLPSEVARLDVANEFQLDNSFLASQTNVLGRLSIGSAVAPQAALHIRDGFYGGAGYNGSASLILERNNSCFLQILTPDNRECGVLFGNNLGGVRGAMIYSDVGTFDLRFRTDNATRLTIEADGDVGIGTTAPTERLHVAGNFLATGSLSTSNFKAFPATDPGGSPTANVLGGYVGNVIGPGVTGATIVGGGRPGFGTGGNFFQEVLDDYGFVGGGSSNRAGDGVGAVNDASYATAVGGLGNEASAILSSVLGGEFNQASAERATVGGGANNRAQAGYSFVGGGGLNQTSATYAFVGGGNANNAAGQFGVIGGGRFNNASNFGDTVGGGDRNEASGLLSTVAGGDSNTASGVRAAISGGESNTASGSHAAIGGGSNNVADDYFTTIAGGSGCEASGQFTFVGGGFNNHATENYAVVVSGASNLAYGPSAVIVGGSGHSAAGDYSFIGAGESNTALGDHGTCAGGQGNSASGDWSACPGGSSCAAGGNYSFAAGRRAKVRNAAQVGDADGDQGTFVWADATNADFASTGPNQFLIRAVGGVGMGVNDPLAALHVRDGSSGTGTIGSNRVAVFERSSSAFINVLTPTANESGILFGNPSGSSEGAVIFNDAGGQDLRFRTMNTNRMTITSSGLVGVNTTAPASTLQVVGTLSATVKNFVIDHPLDPEHLELVHSCVESDEYKNLYDGLVTTDKNGYATITLPDWFDALNENFRYQLTIIDESDSGDARLWARVVKKLRDNQFTIRTARGGVEVSWQVTGTRRDDYAKRHPLEVERAKPGPADEPIDD